MTLEREGAVPIANPSPARIVSELKKLKSYGRSSFASLTDTDGSYVQVGGGGMGCLVERREARERIHFRAFLETPRVPFPDGTALVFGGGEVALMRDEWLTIHNAVDVFLAFRGGAPFPGNIRWRDISSILGLR